SDDHACEDQPHPLSDHQIENIESLGAKSHAYADLSLPLGDGEGEKTIQTDDGQDQSEGGEPPKQAEIKSLRRNIIVSDFPHCVDSENGQRRVELGDLLPHRS